MLIVSRVRKNKLVHIFSVYMLKPNQNLSRRHQNQFSNMMVLQSRVWQDVHLFWVKLSLQFLAEVRFFFCQHASGERAVAIALLCADGTNLPVPALREGVIILFLEAVQVLCSNKPDSMWFLIDLEIGVLQKALRKITLQSLCLFSLVVSSSL